ncbi:MAG TPA: HAD-IC family P-type ATPase, partial [Pirellulaceae bacterium]|nr:HAD-IC family P-type ATPase [Pirellulaceae bacterium]
MNSLDRLPQIHNVAPQAVATLLQSRASGLADREVVERQRELGRNTLEVRHSLRWLKLLVKHFTNFFSLLLDFSAALCFIAERVQPGENMALLGWALLVVALLNGLFAFAQEFRAERAMEELKKFLPQEVVVRRGGRESTVSAEELVPGDILIVAEGAKIPADARVIAGDGLLVNNAPLTGESRSLAVSAAPCSGRLVDSGNILFAGCAVLRGSGEAVVFATGRRTEFGKIAMLSHQLRRPPSPLEREVARMARVLSLVATSMGLLFFIYGVFSGQPLLTNLVFMMGIIVANVPEGLLPTLTLALSMGSLRMARKQVLVKSLEAVEALGSVHVICTDKTGTLTRNELAITSVVDPLTGRDFPRGSPQDAAALHAAMIASDVRKLALGRRGGDPLDIAVAEAIERDTSAGAATDTILRRFPFDVRRRRQGALAMSGGELLFAAKGAWEALRPLVTHCVDGRPAAAKVGDCGDKSCDGLELLRAADSETTYLACALDAEALNRIDEVVHQLASQGKRVIAVVERRAARLPSLDAPVEQFESDLVLLGLLA